jgi:UDPglucose 6-dehydrogenase
MAQRIIAAMGGDINAKTVAILGLAFKPETDDMRDSPTLDIVPNLLAHGAAVRVYDPKSMQQAKSLLPVKVTYADSALDCIADADAVVLATEWNEFRALTPAQIVGAMRGRIMVDLRNVYEPDDMKNEGLDYSSIGR